MIKIFTDSGSSIKQNEKDKYGVEILPLRITLGDKEYRDGIDLTTEEFYHALIDEGLFPKTSLPSLGDTEAAVKEYTSRGDDVIIITISAKISGTYNTLKMLFADDPRVRVIDSRTAVGGIRLLVIEAMKHLEKGAEEVEKRICELIPRIKAIAIPETLEYLHRGGRLSRSAMVAGSLIQMKPLTVLDSKTGKVGVIGKAIGLRRAMATLADSLNKYECDENYPIIPSYTYSRENLDTLIGMTDEKYHKQMIEYDDLDPAIACHWGPNAFGYIFVSKK